ncbi:MAG: class I SAM-dependent methyltransferase [Candidatus Moranbacteria bacterium]|nr:class I SAM-dependent methyltransferase [Candidatus Moranbacteria bacterium]
MTDKKRQMVDTYNKSAREMTWKFDDIGARVEDVGRLFGMLGKENPFILEIGCGSGRDAEEILKRTDRYLGIDISETFVSIARERVPRGRFEVADVEAYDFPQGIDVIVSFASLLHSDKQSVAAVLAKAHDALVPGGIFYISLKEGDYADEGVTRTDDFGTRTYFYYRPEAIQELAGPRYKTEYLDRQNLREQYWFTIALRKI